MKRILTAIVALWSMTAIAGLPPTTLGGQAGTSSTTFNFKVPNNQATAIAGAGRIETGNKNLLINPSFEHSTVTTGWTTTNTFTSPTSTLTKEASINIQDGAGSLKAVFGGTSTGAWSIYQDTTLYASGKSGQDAEASVWIYSAATDVWLCPRTNGVTPTASIANGCVQYTNIGAPQKLTVFMLYGSTSTGFVVTGSTSSTTVYLDDAYLGDRRPQMQGITTTPWTSYTPAANVGTTTPTTNQCKYKRIGSDITVQCFFTSGTVPANPYIGLPTGLTLDTSKIITTATTTGPAQSVGMWQNNGANLYGSMLAVPGTSTTLIYFGNGFTSSGGLGSTAGTPYPTSNVAVTINFSVPITEWAGDNNALTTKCDDPRNCETVFSTKVSSGGAVSNQSTGATYTWVGTCSLASSTYTCPISGFTVAPNCWITTDDSPSNGRLLSVTSSQVQILTYNTTSNAALVEGFTLSCQKQGTDYTNAKISQQIIQSRDVPLVQGLGNPVIKMATVTCAASPTITFPSGQTSWATVAAGSGTAANYSCTVTMSGFTTTPICTSSGQSGNKTVSFTVNSSTSATAYCTSAGSNCSSSDIQQVICIGK